MSNEDEPAGTKLAFVQFGDKWYSVPESWAWNLSVAGYKTSKTPPMPNSMEEPVNLISRDSL